MKSFNKIIIAAAIVIFILIHAANYVIKSDIEDQGRPYRVEISRLSAQIEEQGADSIDLSACEYVTAVTAFETDFTESDGEYAVREINGTIYRFDYTFKKTDQKRTIMNIFLIIMGAGAMAVLFYIRSRIIAPFEKLKDLPCELAKGNLTVPLKESKDKYFGQFVWGMDLLRENIEAQKQRELDLQREKKLLLLSLSHDIKTPLSAIKLSSKALSRGLYPDREKRLQVAEGINEKADEIENYLIQIVSAAREDFLVFDVKEGEFYLSDLMDSVRTYYKDKLELNKTKFSIGRFDDHLIKGDMDRCVEVMQNFMENALKYGDGKEIAIEFSEEEGCQLVTVVNTGCSLPEDEVAHIFDSFYRGSNMENISGSGLGLYICRQLMQKMNGEVFAEIREDKFAVTAVLVKA